MNADILTITPYMGTDVIKPLVPWLFEGKGFMSFGLALIPSGETFKNLHVQVVTLVAEALFDKIENFASQNQVSDSIGYVLGGQSGPVV